MNAEVPLASAPVPTRTREPGSHIKVDLVDGQLCFICKICRRFEPIPLPLALYLIESYQRVYAKEHDHGH